MPIALYPHIDDNPIFIDVLLLATYIPMITNKMLLQSQS